MKMVASIFTYEKLANPKIAEGMLTIMKQNGFIPEKIGLFEPLKQKFTDEDFINLWMIEEPGCYEEGRGMVGLAGGFIAKCKKPNLSIYTNWWDCPNVKSVNRLMFYFSKETFRKHQQELESLFKQTVDLTNSFYGYISESGANERQGPGNELNDKLPGIYWCNYFSQQVVEELGKEKVESFDWWKSDIANKGGSYLYLHDSPFNDPLNTENLETNAKIHLGIDKFEETYELEGTLDDLED